MTTVWKLLLNLVEDVAEVRIRTEMTDLVNRIRRVRTRVKEKKAINRKDALNAMAKAKLMRRVRKTAEVAVEDEPTEAEEASSLKLLMKVLVALVSKLELAVEEVPNKLLELKMVITKKLDWCTERWIKSLKAMLTVQCRSKAVVLEPLKCKRKLAPNLTPSTKRISSQLSRVVTPIETN